MSSAVQQIDLKDFDSVFANAFTELSSSALGGEVLSCSDEFFAEASNLLKPDEPKILKGQYGPNGALFDGWESRRHNPSYDWTILRLGAAGTISGFDVDTRWFNGNEAPAVTVHAIFKSIDDSSVPGPDDASWAEILPMTPCGPASRHLFRIQETATYSHLKLSMYPDGGIGRFRVYGTVKPSAAKNSTVAIDLAHVHNGGRCVAVSDQHFGKGANLLLPGRGIDMGDGWETKRSRGQGHTDWAIIKLGQSGFLEFIEIDTAHFVGNFPAACEVHGISADEDLPSKEAGWELLLARTKLGPHRQHYFQLLNPATAYTHIRITIFPDGGIKRVRVIGRPSATSSAEDVKANPVPLPSAAPSSQGEAALPATIAATAASAVGVAQILALPLTPEAFAPYGSVIQSYPDSRSAPPHTVPKKVNFGTATKYSWLSDLSYLQPASSGDRALLNSRLNFCVYRCDPEQFGGQENAEWQVKVLERHEFTTQAFVPMGNGGGRYLVIVALPGSDGQPDVSSLRAFLATSSQGISYHPNIWHHPMIALDAVTDFACLVHETGDARIDCEIRQYNSLIAVVRA